MSLKLQEWFGFDPKDHSATARKYRRDQVCPFVGGTCIKKLGRSQLISGACTLKPATSEPVICCPNRLYAEDHKVLLDTALHAFGPEVRLCRETSELVKDGRDVMVFGKRWGKELRLPSR